MEFRFDNYILKAFLASGLLSVVMMVLALGLIQLFRYGPSLPTPLILIMAAVAFVLSASFFERYEVGSIMWSMLVSLIATLMLGNLLRESRVVDRLSKAAQHEVINIATLFLDRELRIMRVTPRTRELFNIRASDHGRPFTELRHRLGDALLEQDALRVLERLTPIEREIQSETGEWYLARINPYRSSSDQIQGVVITLVEITRLKNAELAARSGAFETIIRLQQIRQRLEELGADYVIESVGTVATYQQAFQMVRHGGQVSAFGITGDQETMALAPFDLVLHEKKVTASCAGVGNDWSDAITLIEHGRIDPKRAYRIFSARPGANGERRSIDVFFYDGPISRAVSFEHLLRNSDGFAERLALAVAPGAPDPQLVSVAVDGETFGGGASLGIRAILRRPANDRGSHSVG